ncbi:MAG: DUF1203 domain-containing protein [Sphingomonadaceae bacterium]|nr:DUF1203 domain-containing protein [Sphingomonadaceae bacterium]
MSGYVIEGLDPARFRPLYGLDNEALAARGAIRMRSDSPVGYPCRVTLRDVAPGADVLLLNHEHQPAATPYRSRHAIFVREGAEEAARFENAIPEQLAIRLLSVRAFDANDMMIDADVVDGGDLDGMIVRYFELEATSYLHVHNARRGCFAARVNRL